MTRLIASLLVALALFVSPLATSNAAAMDQMTSCASMGSASSCPEKSRSEKPCAPAACDNVCASVCFLPVLGDRPYPDAAAKAIGLALHELSGLTPEAEPRPPRKHSET
jgi:hypothetical protein